MPRVPSPRNPKGLSHYFVPIGSTHLRRISRIQVYGHDGNTCRCWNNFFLLFVVKQKMAKSIWGSNQARSKNNHTKCQSKLSTSCCGAQPKLTSNNVACNGITCNFTENGCHCILWHITITLDYFNTKYVCLRKQNLVWLSILFIHK